MRLLFALRHAGYVRNFRSTIELLGERGHEIVLVLGPRTGLSEPVKDVVTRLEAQIPGLTVREGVELHKRSKRDLGFALRQWLAYLWFFEPELHTATKARERLGDALPLSLSEAAAATAENHDSRRSLVTLLYAIDRLLPVPEAFSSLVAAERPDAVVVSPLIEGGMPQVNYLRAAQELGIPTGLCVASWDNLTSKGPIHEPLDLVAVWNEAQKREAVELHRVPPERIAVTGAPLYDEWFGREPTTTRAELCNRLGISPERPYLLYVCSSGFVARDEAGWILTWLEGLRGSGLHELADIQVVIRPHPQNQLIDDTPEALRLRAAQGTVIHPAEKGESPVTEAALAEYYDTLHHAAAVVGVNTSAMIEAAITGRGIYTLLGRYPEAQEDSLHFVHLRSAGGGLIHETTDAGEHASALAGAVRGEDVAEASERARRFLADFIRPHGLDRPATPLLADALEALAASGPRQREPVATPSQEWLDRVAAELEPIFHIRHGRSIATTEARRNRRRWAAE